MEDYETASPRKCVNRRTPSCHTLNFPDSVYKTEALRFSFPRNEYCLCHEVELVLPVPSTKATSVNAPVNAPANASVKLSKTQIAIVKAIINNNHVTYDDLKTILGVDRSTITRNIAVLKEKGAIRRVGEDKNGYWEVLLDIKLVD